MQRKNDPTLQQAADIIQQNSWHMLDTKNLVHQPDVDLRELKLLRNVKNELTLFLVTKIPSYVAHTLSFLNRYPLMRYV